MISDKDIATTLGIPKGTVKSRLHRAKVALIKNLKEKQPPISGIAQDLANGSQTTADSDEEAGSRLATKLDKGVFYNTQVGINASITVNGGQHTFQVLGINDFTQALQVKARSSDGRTLIKVSYGTPIAVDTRKPFYLNVSEQLLIADLSIKPNEIGEAQATLSLYPKKDLRIDAFDANNQPIAVERAADRRQKSVAGGSAQMVGARLSSVRVTSGKVYQAQVEVAGSIEFNGNDYRFNVLEMDSDTDHIRLSPKLPKSAQLTKLRSGQSDLDNISRTEPFYLNKNEQVHIYGALWIELVGFEKGKALINIMTRLDMNVTIRDGQGKFVKDQPTPIVIQDGLESEVTASEPRDGGARLASNAAASFQEPDLAPPVPATVTIDGSEGRVIASEFDFKMPSKFVGQKIYFKLNKHSKSNAATHITIFNSNHQFLKKIWLEDTRQVSSRGEISVESNQILTGLKQDTEVTVRWYRKPYHMDGKIYVYSGERLIVFYDLLTKSNLPLPEDTPLLIEGQSTNGVAQDVQPQGQISDEPRGRILVIAAQSLRKITLHLGSQSFTDYLQKRPYLPGREITLDRYSFAGPGKHDPNFSGQSVLRWKDPTLKLYSWVWIPNEHLETFLGDIHLVNSEAAKQLSDNWGIALKDASDAPAVSGERLAAENVTTSHVAKSQANPEVGGRRSEATDSEGARMARSGDSGQASADSVRTIGARLSVISSLKKLAASVVIPILLSGTAALALFQFEPGDAYAATVTTGVDPVTLKGHIEKMSFEAPDKSSAVSGARLLSSATNIEVSHLADMNSKFQRVQSALPAEKISVDHRANIEIPFQFISNEHTEVYLMMLRSMRDAEYGSKAYFYLQLRNISEPDRASLENAIRPYNTFIFVGKAPKDQGVTAQLIPTDAEQVITPNGEIKIAIGLGAWMAGQAEIYFAIAAAYLLAPAGKFIPEDLRANSIPAAFMDGYNVLSSQYVSPDTAANNLSGRNPWDIFKTVFIKPSIENLIEGARFLANLKRQLTTAA